MTKLNWLNELIYTCTTGSYGYYRLCDLNIESIGNAVHWKTIYTYINNFPIVYC